MINGHFERRGVGGQFGFARDSAARGGRGGRARGNDVAPRLQRLRFGCAPLDGCADGFTLCMIP